VNALSSLWEKLSNRAYREAFAASVVKRMVPLQIRVLRKQRDWSQARLASESSLTQGVISRAEDPEYGNLTVNTLVRIAAGFDCVYVGRFVPFSGLAKWYSDLSNEQLLEVPSFEKDSISDRKEVQSAIAFSGATLQSASVYGGAVFSGTSRQMVRRARRCEVIVTPKRSAVRRDYARREQRTAARAGASYG